MGNLSDTAEILQEAWEDILLNETLGNPDVLTDDNGNEVSLEDSPENL
jgi:hypothetical protein